MTAAALVAVTGALAADWLLVTMWTRGAGGPWI